MFSVANEAKFSKIMLFGVVVKFSSPVSGETNKHLSVTAVEMQR